MSILVAHGFSNALAKSVTTGPRGLLLMLAGPTSFTLALAALAHPILTSLATAAFPFAV